MILIHSRPNDDTTIEIIEWLLASGRKILRVNTVADLAGALQLAGNGGVDAVYMNGAGMLYSRLSGEDLELNIQVQDYISKDITATWAYLHGRYLARIPFFGTLPYPGNSLNKLLVLEAARRYGFQIPRYELVFSKSRLEALSREWGKLICKSLVDGASFNTGSLLINGQFTEAISAEDIRQLNETFSPTLVQQQVEKQFEVRVFCYREKIYAIAMFTQTSQASEVDGRRDDSEKPQRRVPYRLPAEQEQNLSLLLNDLGLSYSSVDFIVTPAGELVFLEVNPYGQYGFLSRAGNYYIEKQIAESLCI